MEQDATVIQIAPDLDPQGKLMSYQVALAFQMPATGNQVVWKHVLHIIIPTEKWVDQFKMGQDYHVTISENGEVTTKRLV